MGSFGRDDRGGRGGGGRSFGRRDFGPRSFDRNRDRGNDRPMFKTTCSNCGKECEVPFRPTTGKPVYCSECFEKMGPRRTDSPRPERSEFRAPNSDQNKGGFDALNAKLDRILRLLEAKTSNEASAPVAQTVETSAEPKEVKAPKAKKESKKKTSAKKKN